MFRFANILCVLEPEQQSSLALTRSVRLAESNQAKLTVISIIEPPSIFKRFAMEQEDEQQIEVEFIQQHLEALTKQVKQHTQDKHVEIRVLMGTPFVEIIRQVLLCQFDLVVKSPQSQDWIDRLLGSNDMHLLRKCPCPVLMVKPDANDTFDNILATVDVEDDLERDEARVQQQLNRTVLSMAGAFAINEAASLHIGSVWNSDGEDFLRHSGFAKMPPEKVDKIVADLRQDLRKSLDDAIITMRQDLGKEAANYLAPQVHFVKGVASQEIAKLTQSLAIDLIVMGTVARVGVQGFIIGNTAEQILEQVNCSVLAVKPPGFKTPISLQ